MLKDPSKISITVREPEKSVKPSNSFIQALVNRINANNVKDLRLGEVISDVHALGIDLFELSCSLAEPVFAGMPKLTFDENQRANWLQVEKALLSISSYSLKDDHGQPN